MPSGRVLAFVERVREFILPSGIEPPPPLIREAPGAYALFTDENERDILYALPWPYVGCPTDERTNSTTWLIDGQVYQPSRRDARGNWIFRRCAR